MAIIDSLYNPIEQKQKLDDWNYMLKDNKNCIKDRINSFKEDAYSFLQNPTEAGKWIILCGVFTGIFEKIFPACAGNFMGNFTMSIYQTKADQDLIRI